MYRTGDRARRLPGGDLEYIGRVDHQLKIRGFRVEPEEIESELNGHPSVRAAVVKAFELGEGGRRLVAYYVADAGAPLSSSELRRFVQGRLPDYMVPSLFVPVESLPISPNGENRPAVTPAAGRGSPCARHGVRRAAHAARRAVGGNLGGGAGRQLRRGQR